MRVRFVGILVWVAAFWGGLGQVRAKSNDVTVAVLGIEALDGGLDNFAAALNDALRQRVTTNKGFRLVPGRDLVEVKLIFSCPDEAPACMTQAAKSLGATKLLFGSIKKAGPDGFLVTLKMLDTGRAMIDAWVAEQVTRAQLGAPAIRVPVHKWFATLTGQGTSGAVRVSSDVGGATITLDGVPIGITKDEPVVLPSVAAGHHQLVATKHGYEPIRREVDVRAGETEEMTLVLGQPVGSELQPVDTSDKPRGHAATPAAVPNQTTSDEPGRGSRIAAWTTLGAGAVSLALAIKFGLAVKDVNTQLDPYRRFTCDTGICGLNGPASELTPDEQAKVDSLKSDGSRDEKLQYVFYGASAVLLGASGYLFYKGYIAEDSDGRREAKDRTTFSLLPRLTPTGAGLSGLLRF